MIEDIADSEPFAPFERWFALAAQSEDLAETMTLATAAGSRRQMLTSPFRMAVPRIKSGLGCAGLLPIRVLDGR